MKEDFLLGTRGVSLNPIGNTLWSLRLYAISTFIVPISARDGKRSIKISFVGSLQRGAKV